MIEDRTKTLTAANLLEDFCFILLQAKCIGIINIHVQHLTALYKKISNMSWYLSTHINKFHGKSVHITQSFAPYFTFNIPHHPKQVTAR